MKLPKKIEDLTPYTPAEEAPGTVPLDANESFLPLSPALRETVGQLARDCALNRYPDPLARELCEAFAGYYGIDPKGVTAGNGSDELISLCLTCLVDQGERILTFAPDFSMYRFYAQMAGILVEELPVPVGETPSLTKAARLIREKDCSMVLFSNPCNPTGQGIPAGELRAFIRETPAIVVLDEAYMDFWDQSLLGEVESYPNLILLRTCSKALGLAGLRIGFAVAGPRLTEALRKGKSPYNVGTLTQAIGAAVLSDHSFLESCRRQLTEGAQALAQGLMALAERAPEKIKVYSTTTNFVYLWAKDAAGLREALAQKKIRIRAFSGGYLRISTGAPGENARVLDILKEAIL